MRINKEFFIASLKKDLRFSFLPIMRVVFIIVILTFLVFMAFANTELFTDPKPVNEYPSYEFKTEYDFNSSFSDSSSDPNRYRENWDADDYPHVNMIQEDHGHSVREHVLGFFLLIFLPIVIFLIIFHAVTFSREKRSGYIRTYFHYRITPRELLISKTLNVSIMSLIFTASLLLLTVAVMIAWSYDIWDVFFLTIITYIMTILLYWVFVSISSILHGLWIKGRFVDPIVFLSTGIIFFLLITESGIVLIYSIMCGLYNWNYTTPGILWISNLSPFHLMGRLYEVVLSGESLNIADFVWVPFFIGIIIAGFLIMKRIYPDVFIRETA